MSSGSYLNPPEKAIVLCVDEKSQIQALDRTQPSLPMKPGRAGTMTHDYKRHGTTTLFAALNTLDGTVIGQCLPRHRHQEFLKFLRRLDREFPGRSQLHLILDNYQTHKHPQRQRLAREAPTVPPALHADIELVVLQPRRTMVRGADDKAIRRGVFHSVPHLIVAIDDYLANYNQDADPVHLDHLRRRDPREDRPSPSRAARTPDRSVKSKLRRYAPDRRPAVDGRIGTERQAVPRTTTTDRDPRQMAAAAREQTFSARVSEPRVTRRE